MVVKVYISGSSGNKAVKANQRKAIDFLTALGVKLEIVDISQPELSEERDLMLSTSKPGTEDIGKLPLCPQFFNDQLYCGDYDDFDIALENDTITEFLKLTQSDMVEGKNLPPHDWGDIEKEEIQGETGSANDSKPKENGHLTESTSSLSEGELIEETKDEPGDKEKIEETEAAKSTTEEKEIITEKEEEIETSKDEKVISSETIVKEEKIPSGKIERSESSSSSTSSTSSSTTNSSSTTSSSSSESVTPKTSPETNKTQTTAQNSQEKNKITTAPSNQKTGAIKSETKSATPKSSTGFVKKDDANSQKQRNYISTSNIGNKKEKVEESKSQTADIAEKEKQTIKKETPLEKPKASVPAKKASDTKPSKRDSTSSPSSSSSTSSSSSSSSSSTDS